MGTDVPGTGYRRPPTLLLSCRGSPWRCGGPMAPYDGRYFTNVYVQTRKTAGIVRRDTTVFFVLYRRTLCCVRGQTYLSSGKLDKSRARTTTVDDVIAVSALRRQRENGVRARIQRDGGGRFAFIRSVVGGACAAKIRTGK